MIVIHAVAGPYCSESAGEVRFSEAEVRSDDAAFWRARIEADPDVSIHYVIGRSGTVEASIPETDRAFHAAAFNARSIGIELVHAGDGRETFSPAQIAALTALIRDIRTRHAVPLAHIVTHGDVDRRTCACAGASYNRRIDPGPNFPLAEVRAAVAAPGETVGAADFSPMTGAVDGPLCATRP